MALAILTIVALNPIAIAQPARLPASLPDSQRDYYRNEVPRRAVPLPGGWPERLSAGSLWQVVSVGLNCRRSPGAGYSIVRQFSQGDRLEVEVGRGGSDEVLQNAVDRNGKPWMPVRGASSSDICYVRANSRYIQPLSE